MNPFRLEVECKDECCCMCQFQVQDPTMSVLVQSERKVNNPKCFCFFLPCISDNIVVFCFWRLKNIAVIGFYFYFYFFGLAFLSTLFHDSNEFVVHLHSGTCCASVIIKQTKQLSGVCTHLTSFAHFN